MARSPRTSTSIPSRASRDRCPTRALAYLTGVFTRPAFRDRGVGSELSRAVIDRARESQLHLLPVWPSQRSVPFYGAQRRRAPEGARPQKREGFVPSPEALELVLFPE